MKNIVDILRTASAQKASDVHIATGYPMAFRINGILIYQEEERLAADEVERLLLPILNTNMGCREKFQNDGQVDMSYEIDGSRFRVNVFRQKGNMSAAIRLIPDSIPNIAQLGLPMSVLNFVEKTRGLVLVTGPTGSGKSTTLASLVDYINKNKKCHVITLEDPIEYTHKFNKSIINQREIGKDTDDFAAGLKASLREDPDVILVGEMRDMETIATAITAAETGHLVLSTLHTMSAPQTIERIIDVFPANQQNQVRFQLSMILNGIISQQLIEKSDKSGRTLAAEILVSHTAVNNLIREGNIHQIKNIMQTRTQEGMQTMDASLMELFNQNIISKEDVLKYAQDASYVKNTLGI